MLSSSKYHYSDPTTGIPGYYFEKIQETDCISGTLIDVSDFSYRFNFTRLTFQNETEKFYVAAKKGTIIDERLNLLHPHRFKRFKSLTIKRKGDLFYFYEDVEKDVLLGIIGLSINWTEEEEKEWEENKAYGFDYEKQAEFYGRTIEDVQNQYNDKIFRLELIKALTSTSKGTLNSIAIDGYRGILSFGVAIFPKIIAKDNDNASYYGESICKDGSTQVTSLDKTLFSLKKDQLDELLNRLNNNFYDIPPVSGKDALLQHPFFADKVKDGESISIWIKLEDAGNNTFTSYSYVLGDSRDDINHFLEKREPDLLRHIMYLRSLQTEYLLKSNEIARQNTKSQAIHSAIATIMSRNMSHNLGSHVLYYTQQDLLDKSKEYDNKLRRVLRDSTDLEQKKNVQESLNTYSGVLRGASHIVALLKNRTSYVASFTEDIRYPSLPVNFKSDVWDYINVDQKENGPLTSNFYLMNLVKSEGYEGRPGGNLRLILNDTIDEHHNLAFPGGVMSVQAFCNILENFIRNSAKYWHCEERLPSLEIRVGVEYGINQCIITISDNKGDGDSIAPVLNSKIRSLRILNENFSINKEDKGIKEMLLSYLWLISNTLGDYSVGSLVNKIDSRDKDAIEFVNSRFKFITSKDHNLSLQLSLPLHCVCKEISEDSFNREQLDMPSVDVVLASPEAIKHLSLRQVFPRLVSTADELRELDSANSAQATGCDEYKEARALYTTMCSHFDCDINSFKIAMTEREALKYEDADCIKFKTHFSDSPIAFEKLSDYYYNYLYVDSISGANYTKTLDQVFSSSLGKPDANGNSAYKTWRDFSFALKIKESAITRITLIDERFLLGIKRWIRIEDPYENEQEWKHSQIELALKNIRVLGWADDQSVKNSQFNNAYHKVDGFESLCGSVFRPVKPYVKERNKTTCLSIHLGLIEKMLQSPSESMISTCGDIGENYLAPKRIECLMNKIQEVFQPDFMCIHSGRGGLSKELEETILSTYPFIPLATLENLYNNSKFLLAQMFYSLKYSVK